MSPTEFGKLIRDLREKQGLTLEEMEAKFGLKGELIFLLEKGDVIGMVFVKDILEKYQEVFKPETNLLQAYAAILEAHDKYPQVKLEELRLLSFRFFFLVFIFVLAVYFLLTLTAALMPPRVFLLNFAPETMTVTRPSYLLKIKVDQRETTVFINGEEHFPDNEGLIEKELILNPGVNKITIEAINRLNKRTRIEKRLVFQPGE